MAERIVYGWILSVACIFLTINPVDATQARISYILFGNSVTANEFRQFKDTITIDESSVRETKEKAGETVLTVKQYKAIGADGWAWDYRVTETAEIVTYSILRIASYHSAQHYELFHIAVEQPQFDAFKSKLTILGSGKKGTTRVLMDPNGGVHDGSNFIQFDARDTAGKKYRYTIYEDKVHRIETVPDVAYLIGREAVTKAEFERFKSTITWEEPATEGERPDGFTRILRGKSKTGETYEFVLETTATNDYQGETSVNRISYIR